MVKCCRCHEEIIAHTDFTSGYARYGKRKRPLCYGCCADLDRWHMKRHGRITLYLITNKEGKLELHNWPGTLVYKVLWGKKTPHYTPNVWYRQEKSHIWFDDEFGNRWYGYSIGNNTQICHCRRLK